MEKILDKSYTPWHTVRKTITSVSYLITRDLCTMIEETYLTSIILRLNNSKMSHNYLLHKDQATNSLWCIK